MDASVGGTKNRERYICSVQERLMCLGGVWRIIDSNNMVHVLLTVDIADYISRKFICLFLICSLISVTVIWLCCSYFVFFISPVL